MLIMLGVCGAICAISFLTAFLRNANHRIATVASVMVSMLFAIVVVLFTGFSPGKNSPPRSSHSVSISHELDSSSSVSVNASQHDHFEQLDQTMALVGQHLRDAFHSAKEAGHVAFEEWEESRATDEEIHIRLEAEEIRLAMAVQGSPPAPNPVARVKLPGRISVGRFAIPRIDHKVVPFTRLNERSWRAMTVWTLLSALAIGSFLYLSYLFLDASTRGHFTWSLRFLSLITFGVLVTAVTLLQQV